MLLHVAIHLIQFEFYVAEEKKKIASLQFNSSATNHYRRCRLMRYKYQGETLTKLTLQTKKLRYLGLELILINCLHTQFNFAQKQFF